MIKINESKIKVLTVVMGIRVFVIVLFKRTTC